MVKRDTRLGKVSNFYEGQTVFFATKHGKEEILAPLFRGVGLACKAIPVDTDEFGTFSGEVERRGSIREILRNKIQAAARLHPSGRLFLASEGSFGPHPLIGFLPTDLESLLLWDCESRIEIYAEYLCRRPIHREVRLTARDDFRDFLRSIDFPSHAVIVHPHGKIQPIFKGLRTELEVAQAMLECFLQSEDGTVTLLTDLRADQNETRRKAIAEAGRAMIEKLQSICPECSTPGFGIVSGVPGMVCEACGEATSIPRAVLYECVRCGFVHERPRPDGKQVVHAEECEHCNP
jgi:hypothetical protein